MAIYHLSVKSVSRGGGRSATAAAAYRSAEKVVDQTSGQVFDYTRRRGVEYAEIVLPSEAPKRDLHWAQDRESLWNAAEAAEKRKDARVAREYEIALPHELTGDQRKDLVRAFSQEVANRYGVAVDFAVHSPHRKGDDRNHHAHVMTTTRRLEATGLGAKSDIELSDADRAKRGLCRVKDELVEVRERWASLTNEKLKEHGHEARVDHRSLEAQGIAREPTTHLGPAVTAMYRRGVESEVGWRVQAEAHERLKRAAELGRLEKDNASIEHSLVVVDGNIRQALLERDAAARGVKLGPQPGYDIDAARRESLEQWREYRAAQIGPPKPTRQLDCHEKTLERERELERGRDGPDYDLSM